eukprot:scaffold96261_cov34-Tisochrysis_lutea.AAC.4
MLGALGSGGTARLSFQRPWKKYLVQSAPSMVEGVRSTRKRVVENRDREHLRFATKHHQEEEESNGDNQH